MTEYSEQILSNILTYGREGSEVGSRALFEKIKPKDISLQIFQRMITKDLEEYQDMQLDNANRDIPFAIILSNDKGYYAATTPDEAIRGLLFYQSRMQPMFARRKKIKRMIAAKFKVIVEDKRPLKKQENQLQLL